MASHPPSVRVVEAVARTEGVSPMELSPPLSTVVDPDAIDALADHGEGSLAAPVEIEFEYRDTVVRITTGSSVNVSVTETGTSADATGATSDQVTPPEK